MTIGPDDPRYSPVMLPPRADAPRVAPMRAPKAIKAMDANPYVPQAALNRLERDAEYAGKYGLAREDVQNARRIIGEGPGWISRLREALAKGAVLPGVALALMSQQPPPGEGR